MIARWFCLKECKKIGREGEIRTSSIRITLADGEPITSVQCGAAGSRDIVPGSNGSPKQVHMRCGCNFGSAEARIGNDIFSMLTNMIQAHHLAPQQAVLWSEVRLRTHSREFYANILQIEKKWEEQCLKSKNETKETSEDEKDKLKDEKQESKEEENKSEKVDEDKAKDKKDDETMKKDDETMKKDDETTKKDDETTKKDDETTKKDSKQENKQKNEDSKVKDKASEDENKEV